MFLADSLKYISADFYEKTVGTPLEKKSIMRVAQIVRARALEGSKKNVLDIGCGSGVLAVELADIKTIEYIGIDINEGFIKRARERLNSHHNFTFFVEDIARYCPNLKFDIIILCGTYHHIPDEHKAVVLRRVASVLAERGIVVLYEKLLAPYSTKKEFISANRIFYRKRFAAQFLAGEIGPRHLLALLKIGLGDISAFQEYKIDYQRLISYFFSHGLVPVEEHKIWPARNLFKKNNIGDFIFVFAHGN